MGYGDVLMTMGEAKRLHEQTGKKVCLPRRYCPELYQGIDYITDNPVEADILLNDAFPATDRSRTTNQKIVYKKYKPYPADLKVPEVMLDKFGDFIFIEPHTKTLTSADNRNWGWNNFCAVVEKLRIPVLQPSYGLPILPGAVAVASNSFLYGVGILKKARTALMAEGGLMHAAAAVGVPSVVIFGGFISPQVTGYDMHTNLYVGGEPCGHRFSCQHCREAMKQISVSQVVAMLEHKLAAQLSRLDAGERVS
jgi:ADP-heptose:LPS heptosyltransferase